MEKKVIDNKVKDNLKQKLQLAVTQVRTEVKQMKAKAEEPKKSAGDRDELSQFLERYSTNIISHRSVGLLV